MRTFRILVGDVMDGLRSLPDGSVRCCVTSPPYWGLRDYGHAGQIGLEPTPEDYVAKMVEVFREVRRVLAEDGTVWLNLGDSYAGSWGNQGRKAERGTQRPVNGPMIQNVGQAVHAIDCDMDEDCDCGAPVAGVYPSRQSNTGSWVNDHPTLKPKDLVGIPWRVAFALQADGWWLRQDIVWSKPNPMPESVTDRCTKAHEYVFLLSKAARYYYDHEAIAEPASYPEGSGNGEGNRYIAAAAFDPKMATKAGLAEIGARETRNKRSVWIVTTQPFPGAHFAVMPEALVEPCVLAGSAVGDTVLDPFAGSGTVGVVALRHGRHFVGCELNPTYAEMARDRIRGDAPLLNEERAA